MMMTLTVIVSMQVSVQKNDVRVEAFVPERDEILSLGFAQDPEVDRVG